jgi:hypothetical protein
LWDDVTLSGHARAPGAVDPHDLDVRDDGITGLGDADRVVDVCFDDRRVWSFHFVRDSDVIRGRRVVSWPAGLRQRLDGSGKVTLREHQTGVVYYDQHVTFGSGQGRLALTDEQGHPLAVDKLGRVNRLLGDVDAAPMLDALEQVLHGLEAGGVQGFLGYGTLLGAVREGTFIGHDHDADLTYLGSAEHPVDAILESYRLERILRDRGFVVDRLSGISFKVMVAERDGIGGLDVFGSFFWDGLLHVMGQIRAPIRRDQMVPAATVTLNGRSFPAPRQPELWLETVYGRDWRIPDPAFKFATPKSTTNRLGGWFRGVRRNRPSWGAWYVQHDEGPNAERVSSFARWVGKREPSTDQVVDVCCGRGDDVIWWAHRGVPAYGFDFVPGPIERAREAARRDAVPAHLDVANLADSRSALAYGAWLARRPAERRILTGRLAIDALERNARPSLWTLCRMLLRGGRPAFFEVMDHRDRASGERPWAPLVRPPSLGVIKAEISARGGQVRDQEVVESAPGSPLPRRIRLVVTW